MRDFRPTTISLSPPAVPMLVIVAIYCENQDPPFAFCECPVISLISSSGPCVHRKSPGDETETRTLEDLRVDGYDIEHITEHSALIYDEDYDLIEWDNPVCECANSCYRMVVLSRDGNKDYDSKAIAAAKEDASQSAKEKVEWRKKRDAKKKSPSTQAA